VGPADAVLGVNHEISRREAPQILEEGALQAG